MGCVGLGLALGLDESHRPIYFVTPALKSTLNSSPVFQIWVFFMTSQFFFFSQVVGCLLSRLTFPPFNFRKRTRSLHDACATRCVDRVFTVLGWRFFSLPPTYLPAVRVCRNSFYFERKASNQADETLYNLARVNSLTTSLLLLVVTCTTEECWRESSRW